MINESNAIKKEIIIMRQKITKTNNRIQAESKAEEREEKYETVLIFTQTIKLLEKTKADTFILSS